MSQADANARPPSPAASGLSMDSDKGPSKSRPPRTNSIPSGNGQAPALGEVDSATRWGAIMYPFATRQQQSPPQPGDAGLIEPPLGMAPAPFAAGNSPGGAHNLSSVQLHVTVGEDMELQELAGVTRQRVEAPHPRPSSRTMGVLGRHDSGSQASGTPTGGSSSTPCGARPGSGTRHRNNPYDSVSPIKVLTPVGGTVGSMQSSSPPAGTLSLGATNTLPPQRQQPSPLSQEIHGHPMRAGGQPPLSSQASAAAPAHGVGYRGGGGDSDFPGRFTVAGAGADGNGNAASIKSAGGRSVLVPLPDFQPPPQFLPPQGAATYDGGVGPMPTGTRGMASGYGQGARGQWGSAMMMGVDGSAPPQPRSSQQQPSASASAPASAGLQGKRAVPATGLSAVYVDASAGSSPPPPPHSASAEGSTSTGTTEARVPGVLYPPLSVAMAHDVVRYVEVEEPHLCYPCVQLPESQVNHGDTDERHRRIEQRRKQIQYGRETEGYQHYRTVIPEVGQREFHNVNHPITPRPEFDCSKRTFDKLLNEWRRRLHHWDECDPGNVLPPFLPLGVVTLADLGLAPRVGSTTAASASATASVSAGSGGGGAASATAHNVSVGAPRPVGASRPRLAQPASGAAPGDENTGGSGGMLSIATHATAALHMQGGSPIRPESRDGAGVVSTGSFRNNPYSASARSGVCSSPVARINSGSPGSMLFSNASSSFVLTTTANGRTSTCTPSQGPKVDSNFFSPASSSSRAGSPSTNGNNVNASGTGLNAMGNSGLFRVGTPSNSNDNCASLTSTADGGAPRGSGRAFQRSNSSYNAHGAPQAATGVVASAAATAAAGAGVGGVTPSNGHRASHNGGGAAAAHAVAPAEPSHHATPFHQDRASWTGGAPHTPHHHNVLNGPRLFDFDTGNSPLAGSGGFTPQNQQRLASNHQSMPAGPPIPSFSTPTAPQQQQQQPYESGQQAGFLRNNNNNSGGGASLTHLQNGLTSSVGAQPTQQQQLPSPLFGGGRGGGAAQGGARQQAGVRRGQR